MSSKDFCIPNISPIYLNTTDVAYPLLGFGDAHDVSEASVVENIKRYLSCWPMSRLHTAVLRVPLQCTRISLSSKRDPNLQKQAYIRRAPKALEARAILSSTSVFISLLASMMIQVAI